ncbi:MAG TPA: hypothetical protein VGJ22_13875 [Anaerolineales bacterium]|jgi:hypothetical protein
MLQSIHAEITRQALETHFSARALTAIIAANLGQDALSGQFGHDEYHFDNNAFEKGRGYIEAQRSLLFSSLNDGDAARAWSAFGRLTHAAQDFYAHSNYVTLWLARNVDSAQPLTSTIPAPAKIDPVDPALVTSPDLRSGKLYYPQEAVYFVPGLRKLALSILPRDSHAHMNLDSAERGSNFPYAFAAAIKRTQLEFDLLKTLLAADRFGLFTEFVDREAGKPAKKKNSVPSRPSLLRG